MSRDVNQSHLEKLESLPEGWAESSVSEIVQMISANNKKLAQKKYLQQGEFPVIDQGQDFIGGYSDDKSLVVEEEPPFIVFGDHTRAFKFANFKFVPGADGVKIMKPLGVDPKWCFYIFQAIKLPNKGYARHFQYLKESYVPVPPPEQQKRIVAKIEELFSHIDAGIEALKKAKQLLKQYRQSILKAAVTGELTKQWREANKDTLEPASQLLERILKERREKWEEQQLEQFNTKGKRPKDDKWKEKYKKPQKPEGELEMPSTWVCSSFEELVINSQNGISKRRGKEGVNTHVLRLADITDGSIDESAPRDILLSEKERDKYLLKENDLLCIRVNGSNDLVGRMIKVYIKEEWGFCDHFIRFRLPVNLIEIAFVELFFDSQYARDFTDKNKVSSAGQNTVSQRTMGRILVPLPPVNEQKKIMALVIEKYVAIKRLDSEIDNKINKSVKNKQSVLASAFTGVLI